MADTIHNCNGALIVGAGLAGLFTALKLAPYPCVVLSPAPLGEGASSAWAQGGVAAAIGDSDDPKFHADDTMTAGAGTVDAETALSVTADAAARIDDLLTMGTPFDRDDAGQLVQSREAAHSHNRVVRVSGDRAGRAIMDALIARVRQTPSITVLEGYLADDLGVSGGVVKGVFARRVTDMTAEPILFTAQATVLATGGIGGLYAVSTNPAKVRGQGLGMAARAGAVIADAEFVQFHPTGLAVDTDPCPLATEALRGEGATLIDQDGHRFVFDDHPDGELAPRDIVARSIFRKIRDGGKAFLDTRAAIGADILHEFPTVSAYCTAAGIDPVTQTIPVQPAQHFHMGGIKVTSSGKSTLPGMWVCGETSCTGLHGANRLASNSLLEAVVFGARIAQDIRETPSGTAPHDAQELTSITASAEAQEKLAPAEAVSALRDLMTTYVGLERTEAGLETALREIAVLERDWAPISRAFLNMSTAATLITASALKRQESRGGHFRSDFPETNPAMAMGSEITLSEALAIRDAL